MGMEDPVFYIHWPVLATPHIFHALIYFSMGMETPLSVTVGCHLGMEDPVFIYIGRFWQSLMFFVPLSIFLWVWKPLFQSLLAVIWAWKTQI